MKKQDLKVSDKVLLMSGKMAEVKMIFETHDTVRVKLENGIWDSVGEKDIVMVIQ